MNTNLPYTLRVFTRSGVVDTYGMDSKKWALDMACERLNDGFGVLRVEVAYTKTGRVFFRGENC